jgi:7,8-dihydropterin-6-yl-methyl-4-(beta-D-ribofuranosyl)aminobenzene 5'-phosphate synthase
MTTDRAGDESLGLRAVDQVAITIVVDGSVDILLASGGPVQRPPLAHDWSERDPLRAEHGYGLLIETRVGEERHALIYDCGLGRDTFLYNCDVLGIRPADVEGIVLSHGHADHHGGLEGVFGRHGRTGLPLVFHPDALLQRRVVFPTGTTIAMPPPRTADLEREGARVLGEPGPTLWCSDTLLVSGQVARTTAFEKGFSLQEKADDSGWVPDTWIWDDQNVIVNVRDKGLVVASSCSHAGAVNVLLNARSLTGVDAVHAFVGGMHLTGGLFEQIIEPTMEAIAALAPDWLVPGHCTGNRAFAAAATRFPDAFIASSVGTRLVFGGD